LQPRLHLELGLLKLIQAGRLTSIEEAIAGMGGASVPAPPVMKPRAAAETKSAPIKAAETGDWRGRLHAALMELSMPFTADAVEHSEVSEVNGELHFATPKEFSLAMDEKDILKAIEKAGGKPMRLRITLGEAGSAPVSKAPSAKPKEDELSQRALSHPEVRRFQEIFPDAQVRAVRNLKD
jgi:DNA polymerase III subunit gamma/tau